VVSALNANLLEGLAKAGGGIFEIADYRDGDTKAILQAAAVSKVPAKASDERTRIWNERYYLPVVAIMALLVPQFRGQRRGQPRAQPAPGTTGEGKS
jgi:Ca-activated chloride channel family protein